MVVGASKDARVRIAVPDLARSNNLLSVKESRAADRLFTAAVRFTLDAIEMQGNVYNEIRRRGLLVNECAAVASAQLPASLASNRR